jgi:osmotically-inducible protein OsmY
MRRYLIIAAVVAVVGLVGQEAFAQQRAGGAASNQAGFQGGNQGGGQGSAGNFGVGTAGQVDTNARYMRDNRQGAFVGADSGDTDFVGAASTDTGRQSSASRNIRRGGGGTSRANTNRSGRGRSQQDEVRVVLQLGFTPPSPGSIASSRAPAAVASQLAGRMEKSSWIQNRTPLEVSIDQGTATLRGVVATEHDRLLAERLTLLEGGIWKVENQLKVEATADSQQAPALLEPTP